MRFPAGDLLSRWTRSRILATAFVAIVLAGSIPVYALASSQTSTNAAGFTVAVRVTPEQVQPGQQVELSVTTTSARSTTLSNVTVDINNPDGTRIHRTTYNLIHLRGTPRTNTWKVTIPANAQGGEYRVNVSMLRQFDTTTVNTFRVAAPMQQQPTPVPVVPTPMPDPIQPTPEPVVPTPEPVIEPTPEAVVEPTPEPVVEPTPEPQTQEPVQPEPEPEPIVSPVQPTMSIQQMVNQASSGSTVTVPAGVYRETVNINKSITLVAQPGAEIRGSDDWSGISWNASGGRWISSMQVPNFSGQARNAVCSGGSRCQWPEQVFIDGQPLTQVASNPGGMQFSINSSRQIVLGTNPAGRLVEVTTREYWLSGSVNNVTVDGFTMTHAAAPYQQGALNNGGRSNWTIRNNTLSHAHAANVSIYGGTNLQLINNTIFSGGGLGVHGWKADGSLVQGNRIFSNNTEGYDVFWEAGGLKISEAVGLNIRNNEVYSNTGMGIWIDVWARDVEISGNRVHHNSAAGITYELSSHGRIIGNAVWENGHSVNEGPGGSGIFVQASRDTQVRDNVVAWNGAGIVMFADNRGIQYVNNVVGNNDVFMVSHKPWDVHGLAWRQWNGDRTLQAAGSNNRSENNRFYHANANSASWNTFVWVENHYDWNNLNQFNTRSGQSGNGYLSESQKNNRLSSMSVPSSPESR